MLKDFPTYGSRESEQELDLNSPPPHWSEISGSLRRDSVYGVCHGGGGICQKQDFELKNM